MTHTNPTNSYEFRNIHGYSRSITIEAVNTDPSKWEVVKAVEYRPDKDKYVLDAFKRSFPHLTGVTRAEDIYKLASRSASLNEWLAKTNVSYAGSTQVPGYIKGLVNQEDYINAQSKITSLNALTITHAKKLEALAIDYKNRVDAVNRELEEGKARIIQNDKIMHILTLNTTSLPLSIQLAIENFTPSGNITRRTFT